MVFSHRNSLKGIFDFMKIILFMLEISSKYLDVVYIKSFNNINLLNISKRHHRVPHKPSYRNNPQTRECNWCPLESLQCFYTLVPNRVKTLSHKKVSASYTFLQDLAWYLWMSRSEKRVSVDTCKLRRAFPVKGSFNKLILHF